MQRILDIILSVSALVLFSPVLLPLIFVLRFTGEGEVFYVQKRVGRDGREFGLLKLATMLKNSPNIGSGDITLSNDPRVLPLGKLLRKTKLNELPQIWNIAVGHMSIVGPRPMVPKTFEKYSVEAQTVLKEIKPGLTGIGSIFFRDEELFLQGKKDPRKFYDQEVIPFKNELEVWFVRNHSLLVYFKIIFITAWVILFPRSNILRFFFKDMPEVPNTLKN